MCLNRTPPYLLLPVIGIKPEYYLEKYGIEPTTKNIWNFVISVCDQVRGYDAYLKITPPTIRENYYAVCCRSKQLKKGGNMVEKCDLNVSEEQGYSKLRVCVANDPEVPLWNYPNLIAKRFENMDVEDTDASGCVKVNPLNPTDSLVFYQDVCDIDTRMLKLMKKIADEKSEVLFNKGAEVLSSGTYERMYMALKKDTDYIDEQKRRVLGSTLEAYDLGLQTIGSFNEQASIRFISATQQMGCSMIEDGQYLWHRCKESIERMRVIARLCEANCVV